MSAKRVKPVIIYDINVLPEFGNENNEGGFSIMLKIYEEQKIILWDSSKDVDGVKGVEPKVIIHEDDMDLPLKVVDVSGKVPDRIISTGEVVEKPYVDTFQLTDLTKPSDIADYMRKIMEVYPDMINFEFYVGLRGFQIMEEMLKGTSPKFTVEQFHSYGDPGIIGKARISVNKKSDLILHLIESTSETESILPNGKPVNSEILTLKV